MPFIIVGFWNVFKRHKSKIIIWGLPLIWLFVLAMSGPGINRWRLVMMPVIFIFFGLGVDQLKHRGKGIYSAYFLIVVFLLSVNVSRLEGFYLAKAVILAAGISFAASALSNLLLNRRRGR